MTACPPRRLAAQFVVLILTTSLAATANGDAVPSDHVTWQPAMTSELSTPGPMSCFHGNRCQPAYPSVVECTYGDSFRRMFCYEGEPARTELEHPTSACKFVAEKPNQNPYCEAVIDVICPTIGPSAGGTHVAIWGRGFTDVSDIIQLGPAFKCEVIFFNSTLIECVTHGLLGREGIGSSLSLQMVYNSGCVLTEKDAFVYRQNPTIVSVEPLVTMASGGTSITVTGRDLDSIAYPILNIHAVGGTGTTTYSSVCSVENSAKWVCLTPDLRQSQERIQSIRSRPARDTTTPGQNATYFLGFALDGVTWYRNLSWSSSHFAKFRVLSDPKVYPFEGRRLVYRPTWPDHHDHVIIEGEFAASYLSADDIVVNIDIWDCESVVLSDVSITCVPSTSLPDGNYHVEVQIGNYRSSPGELQCDLSPWGNPAIIQGVVGALAAIVIIVIIIVLILLVRRQKRMAASKRDAEQGWPDKYLLGDFLDPAVPLLAALPKPLQKKVSASLVSPNRLNETSVVQTGNLGQISQGWICDTKKKPTMQVTMKGFKEKGAPFRDILVLLDVSMPFLEFKHENLLPVLGVTIVRNSPELLYAHTEHGDLKQFLVKIKEVDINPEVKDLVQLSLNAADGMAYLIGQEVLHGDLAARTCRVDSNAVLRICDNALAQDLYPEDYLFMGEKQLAVPVKWMAPEFIELSIPSVETDMWSFGVLVWEIMSLGETPYCEVSNSDVADHLRQGNRLARPFRAPVALYTLMTHCWAKEPTRRPSFSASADKLRTMVSGTFKPSQVDNYVPLAESAATSVDYNADVKDENFTTDRTHLEAASLHSENSNRKADSPKSTGTPPGRKNVQFTPSTSSTGAGVTEEKVAAGSRVSKGEVESEDSEDDNGSIGAVSAMAANEQTQNIKDIPLKLLETDEPRPEFKPSTNEDASVAIFF